MRRSSLAQGAEPEYLRVEKADGGVVIYDHGKITTIPPKKDGEEAEKKVLTEEEWEKLLEKEAEEFTKKLVEGIVPVIHN